MAALLSSQDFRSFHPLPPNQRPIHRHSRMVSSRSSSPVCLSRPSSRPSTPLLSTKEPPPEATERLETIQRSPKSRRMQKFSAEQLQNFRAHVEQTKKNFESDTSHLPKSTNMGLTNADAAAALSLNPFNFTKPREHNWEEDDVDMGSTPARMPKAGLTTTFNMAIPCLYVSHMANSINFYQKVLGFSVVGKAATHQAIMRRGPPIKPKVVKGRLVNGVPPAGQDSGVRIMLRYRPEEWGELKGDGTGPPQLLIAVSNADDVYKEVSAKQYALRPTGDEYFPEVAFHKAKVVSKPQNKPWGTREMQMLDPDGNKIVFFHDLAY